MYKRVLILGISAVYFLFSAALSFVLKAIGIETKGTLVVLTYHSIPLGAIGMFEQQMDSLLKAGVPVFADIEDRLQARTHHIAVTFDDGFQSFIKDVLPCIRAKKIPVIMFVPVGCLGQVPCWINHSAHEYSTEIVMNEVQLKNIPQEIVKIGSHCVTHPRLTNLTTKQVLVELRKSKAMLTAICRKEITLLSFPYNDYNEHVVNLAKNEGYSRVFANIPTFPASRINFLIGRVDVSTADWRLEYWLKLKGAYQWLPFAVNIKKFVRSKF